MALMHPVGIDLGTTQSAAAHVDASGATQMIPNAEGEILTPSIALFEKEEILVGREALAAGDFAADRIAELAKRDMGKTHYCRTIHGERLPPEVVQGCILRKLRRDIVAAIGPAFRTVVTVPAYFDEPRRKATADAGQMSGLDVLDIVNEPTAAAMAFGEQLGYLDPTGAPRDTLTLLVYDLGGGTFDVTIIRLAPGDVAILATDGDVQLGGYNWDIRIVDHVLERFRDQHPQCPEPDDASRLRLRRRAAAAKHVLSKETATTISFGFGGDAVDVKTTRDAFEAMTADLVERTVFTVRQTLQAAGLLWSNVDRLLFVGGSTRMPMIRRRLAQESGMTPDVTVHPDEAVARGAAIFARFLLGKESAGGVPPKLRVTDVNAHSLGIEGINQQTRRKENVVLIPRNTPLPKEIRRKFVTKEDNQPSVQVQILEGESASPEHCTSLADAAIRNLPPGLKRGTKIEVSYRLEANGRLSVHARVPGAGDEANIELARVEGLEDETVSKWKKIICRDGGFSAFEDALMDFLDEGDLEASAQQPATRTTTLEPATEEGASQAASDALRKKLTR